MSVIMKKQALFAAVFLSLLTAVPAHSDTNPLYESLSRKKEVKVYVAAPVDPESKLGLDVEVYRESLRKALSGRKSIKFATVDSPAGADILVESEFKGFVFSETDPIDMLVGVGAAAMDAAKQDHYASTEVRMTVKDGSGAQRWKDTVRASITDATMTEAESRVRILDRAAELFVREAFGKKK
jgi:hypothetical protein